MKLEYLLPLAQMGVAAALLRWSYLWQKAAMRIMDLPGPAPAFTLLMSMNAPVFITRSLWGRYLPDLGWENSALIAAIGVFWFWVALNVQSWRARGTVVLFSWAPLRMAADLLLIAMGAYLGWFCIGPVIGFPATAFSQLAWPWLIPTWAFLLFWSLGSVSIFGRDLLHCVLRKGRKQ